MRARVNSEAAATQAVVSSSRPLEQKLGRSTIEDLQRTVGNHAVASSMTAIAADTEPESHFNYGSHYVRVEIAEKNIYVDVLAGKGDKSDAPAMKNFAKSASHLPTSWRTQGWELHEIYSAKRAKKFDRWGDLDLSGETRLWTQNIDPPPRALSVSAETLLRYYASKSPDGRIPGLQYPPRLSEFVVLLLQDPKSKLTKTYMFWNDDFHSAIQGLPKTVKGEVAYYTFELPQDFDSWWAGSGPENWTEVDERLKGKTFVREKGLRSGSYEAHRNQASIVPIAEHGAKKDVPLIEAWGKPVAGKENRHYQRIPPFSPPEHMVANFASNSASLGSMIDVPGQFTKEQFLKDLADVVMYLTYYRDVSIVIEGHTSHKGEDSVNQTLSEKRALNVKSYMLEHAASWTGTPLDAGRIQIVGKGSEDARNAKKPRDNDDLEDRKIVIRYVVRE